VDRYKKEQIVEGHVLSKPVVKVRVFSFFLTTLVLCRFMLLCEEKASKLTVGVTKFSIIISLYRSVILHFTAFVFFSPFCICVHVICSLVITAVN